MKKTLKELLSTSAYATIGYISSEADIETLFKFINFNKEFLTQFPKIIVSQNADDMSLLQKANQVWVDIFGDKAVIIKNEVNRGHTFGTFDLDNNIFEYASKNKSKIKWVWKGANDMLFMKSIFDVLVDNKGDFYYINNLGYNSFIQYNMDYSKLEEDILSGEYFYPQTNFYIIKNNIDYLNNKDEVDAGYEKFTKDNPDGKKPWELVPGMDCETHLKKCVERNQLSKVQLMDKYTIQKLISVVYHNNIHDGSHKNITFQTLGNICHYQFLNQQIIQI